MENQEGGQGAGQKTCIFSKKPIYPEDKKAVEFELALLDSDGHCTGESIPVRICASIRNKGKADSRFDVFMIVKQVSDGLCIGRHFDKYYDQMKLEMQEPRKEYKASEMSGGKKCSNNNRVESHISRVEGGAKKSNAKKKKNGKKT
ncbi:unnamed protein product [Cuscuta campestris]|uniref:Uncharacterized protein n=1 Tax=Cuscuta campestris TaxID=132261 RepID=A0A484N7A9_9ASTE|nr:unnamed protein product [Cuscuta campestris]